MKNINTKNYIKWIVFFILWFLLFNIMQLINLQWISSFIKTFSQIILLVLAINISSILFYKTLLSQDEYRKYAFSFINILILIVFSQIITEIIL